MEKANNKVKVNNVVQTTESSTKVENNKFYDIWSLCMSRNPSLVVEAILNGADINGTDINGTDINGTDINDASRSIINMETYITIKR